MKNILMAMLFCLASVIGMAQTKITLTVGNKTMTATLVENEATRELGTLLKKGPINIDMSDYGGFEKVGSLPQSFTTSNRQITTEPGDIMLYQGNNIVIFYGSNSWSYTPLGKIDGAGISELRRFLGEGNISLRISLVSENGIENIYSESMHGPNRVYDMNGNLISKRPLPSGLYVIDGEKTLIQ